MSASMKYARVWSSAAATIVFVIFGVAAYGTTIDIPTDAQTTEGSTAGYFGSNMGLTAQELYTPADMPSLQVGDVITGFSLRLDGSGYTNKSYPSSSVNWSEFNITVGQGNSSLTSTFANNFASAPTTVRSGPLTMGTNFFQYTTSTPEPWGTEITFTTPYVYTGGNLLIQVNDVSPSQILYIDTMGTGQTTGRSIFNAGSASATTDNEGPYAWNWAMQLDVTTVPSPSTLPSLAMGMLGVAAVQYGRARKARRELATNS